MLKTAFTTLLILAAGAGPGLAADPILGKWRAPGGAIVDVSDCGGSFCATVITGRHKGKSVASMRGRRGDYTGSVTDPRDAKTYEGTAEVRGGNLRLKGCAYRVFCRTQNWTRA